MQKIEFILNKKKEIIYIFILFLFSVSVNQYYGNLGLCPIDSFWFFNSGYDALNGYYPFKDYWTIAGPFITFVQAILFKIFGIVSFFVATDRTPSIGKPILIKIDAYAKIDIPTANIPIFDGPNILAKYVTVQKPRNLLITIYGP